MSSEQPTPAPSDQPISSHETPERRAAIIAGFRAFADFLERRPEIPAPYSIREQFSVVHDYDPKTFEVVEKADEEKITIIRRVAALLGVDVMLTETSVYCEYAIAERTFYTAHANLSKRDEPADGGEPS